MHLETVLGADDDAGAEKTNAGENSLNGPAGGVGHVRGVAGWIGHHHDHGGGKTYQTQRLQADRLALKIAIETDQAARERGNAKTQRNLRPVQQCDILSLHVSRR